MACSSSRNLVADIRCLISQPDGVGIHDQFRLPAERRGGCRQAVSCVPSEVCLKPPRAHSFTYAGRELRAPRPSMVVGVEGPADIFRDLSRKPRDATQTQHSATGCSSSPGQLTDGNVVPGRPAALVLGGLFPAVTEYAEVELARRHQRAEHRAPGAGRRAPGGNNAMEDEIAACHCMISRNSKRYLVLPAGRGDVVGICMHQDVIGQGCLWGDDDSQPSRVLAPWKDALRPKLGSGRTLVAASRQRKE